MAATRKSWIPTWRTTGLHDLDWQAFAMLDIRLVFLDLDNTLARHGSWEASAEAGEIVSLVRRAGLEPVLFSNARKKRLRSYASSLAPIPFVAAAAKPKPAALLQFLAARGVSADQALVVGDQLLTDIRAANRAGARSLLVTPLARQELVTVRLKRLLEALLRRLDRAAFAAVPEAPRLQSNLNNLE